ncbi:MAG: 50S ribosomal protein L24 [Limnochordia bacterium]
MFKAHVRKGDTVQVITGEDAGKTGTVLEVSPASQRVVIDGINILKRHTRPTQTNPQGGIVERPGAVHVSNVMLVCPNCSKAARTGRSRQADGSVARICRRCGKAID